MSTSEGGENSTTSIPRSIIEIQRSIIEMFKEYGATISDVGSQDPGKCFKVEDRGDEGRFLAMLDTDHLFIPGCECFKYQCTGIGTSQEEALEALRDSLQKAHDGHLEMLPHGHRSLTENQRSLIEKYKESGATFSDVGSQDPEKCFTVLEVPETNGLFVAILDKDQIIGFPGRSCCQTKIGLGYSREGALDTLLIMLEKEEIDHEDGHPREIRVVVRVI